MGNSSNCCAADKELGLYEQKMPDYGKLNEDIKNGLTPINDDIEQLQNFPFHYDNILRYLGLKYSVEYNGKTDIIDELPHIDIKDNIDQIARMEKKEHLGYLPIPKTGEKFKKTFVKSINFNYDSNEITDDDLNQKYPIQYFVNKNNLKEVRILRNHQSRFFIKCNGYNIDQKRSSLHFLYDYYPDSLETFITQKQLNFVNKIRVLKNLLDLVKNIHTKGIISLDLSINSLRFTSKLHQLKLVSFGNSLDLKSFWDIDRNSKINTSVNIHDSPEIVNEEVELINWTSDIWSLGIILVMVFSDRKLDIQEKEIRDAYEDRKLPGKLVEAIGMIEDVYVRGILVGLLRFDPEERPNVFEIIDVYNKLVKVMDYAESYYLGYSKSEVLGNIFVI